MPRKFVDLSIAIKHGSPSDPPGMIALEAAGE
jgi:hypothetical protein